MKLIVDATVLDEVQNGNFDFQSKPRDEDNRPEVRRNRNLATLLMAGGEAIPASPEENLTLANCVHLPRYTNFLETVWKRSREKPGRFDEKYPEGSDSESEEGEVGIAAWTFSKSELPLQDSWEAELIAFSCDDGAIFEDTADALKSDLGVVKSAVQSISEGNHTFALVTHPGHHAGRSTHGGYCFLNNAAIAAKLLSDAGKKVAIIDVDYHGGNGTFQLLPQLPGVGFVSLHAENNYPWVEMGEHGRNLPKDTEWTRYSESLSGVLTEFSDKDVIIVSAGFDALSTDPVAGDEAFALTPEDFAEMGKLFKNHGAKILFIQEGGYDLSVVPKAAKKLTEAFIQ